MTFILFILVLASVSLNALAQIALRKAMLVAAPMPSLSDPVALGFHLAGNIYLWCGLVLFGGSIVIWLGVLARIPVSVAYPMTSLGYVIAVGGSVVLLHEPMTLIRIFGLLLICSGVFLLAWNS